MIPLRQMLKQINLGVQLERHYSNLGSGAGKGGGSGGSIREAGGRLGEIGAAAEEAYFRKKNLQLVEKMKKKKADEILENLSILERVSNGELHCSVLGSGAGKGGGSGGSIHEARGRLGKIGAAAEEVDFRKKNLELVEKIKKKKEDEISHYRETVAKLRTSKEKSVFQIKQIKKNEDSIKRAQGVIDRLNEHTK